jgi:hypothetical protein
MKHYKAAIENCKSNSLSFKKKALKQFAVDTGRNWRNLLCDLSFVNQ